jgi:ubiquinone/menaquinone biosynthesis C-methylase UbiE
MEKRLAGLLDARKPQARVLEIGSGPVGIVSALPWGERYALDPLEDFYKTNAALIEFRNSDVRYLAGTGETIPFPDAHFDLVVIDNVIDHVHRADAVLREIGRVLRPDGYMYLAVNVHTPWGGFLHEILSRLRIDRGHPYTFTPASIRTFLGANGFDVLRHHVNDYYEARHQDRASSSMTDKIKGYTGLSEFVFYGVCAPRMGSSPVASAAAERVEQHV